MKIGKYENDYYVIGGCYARDRFGNRRKIYWVTWLDNGMRTGGFLSAQEAANCADRIAMNQEIKQAEQKGINNFIDTLMKVR